MLPLALGLVIGAGSSSKRVARFGTTRVVTFGLVGLSAVLAASLLWTPTMGYAAIGLTCGPSRSRSGTCWRRPPTP